MSAITSIRRRSTTPAVNYGTGEVVVGRYQVRERVGAGPLGAVYRAEDLTVREDLAVRVIWPELVPDDGARLRFLRGVTAARALGSRYVGAVRDAFVDEINGVQACVVIGDFLGRPTLAERLARRLRYQARFLLEELRQLVSQLGTGLAAIHRAGLVHGNLRTRNVFFSGEEIRIGDMGVAASLPPTLVASALARDGHDQPGAAAGVRVTAASDVLAFAEIAGELLGLSGGGGAGADPTSAAREVLERALGPDPAERFADAAALTAALLDALEQARPVEPPPAREPAADAAVETDAPVEPADYVFLAGAFLTPNAEIEVAASVYESAPGPSVLADGEGGDDDDGFDTRTPPLSDFDAVTPVTQPRFAIPDLPAEVPEVSEVQTPPPLAVVPLPLPPPPPPLPFEPEAAVRPRPAARPGARAPLALVVGVLIAASALAATVVYRVIDAGAAEKAAMARVEKARVLERLRDDAARAAAAAAIPVAPVAAPPATAPAPEPPTRFARARARDTAKAWPARHGSPRGVASKAKAAGTRNKRARPGS